MTLYEINEAMMNLIDPETGEIMDIDAFDKLNLKANEKIENVALWYKNLISDVDAMKNEEKNLKERRQTAENKAARLKNYLEFWLNGQKFETPRVKCSYRKTSSIVVEDEVFIEWARKNGHEELLTFTAPTANKNAIKQFIAAGGEPLGASTSVGQSLSIK